MGRLCVGLASVAGYCRVRPYDGCATQAELDAGYALGLNRAATADETFRYFIIRPLLERKKLEQRAQKA